MERRAEAYLVLVEELGLAWGHFQGQYVRNRQMTGRIESAGEVDEHDLAALGYTAHNLYNALENYFSRVAKFFENFLDSGTWHRDLVDRMTFSIEGVRPALLPPDVRRRIHELRSFRHVFRGMYGSALDPDRLGKVNALMPSIVEAMGAAHERFTAKHRAIAAEL